VQLADRTERINTAAQRNRKHIGRDNDYVFFDATLTVITLCVIIYR